ncbi:MAG: PfkB family carbohydrate kinase [Chloroflexi bacterium]|nr:PfkB family carbohydrate kinase [Chloroflexota bacterium]MCL5108164.1 PfkB family carbohydrate kinase [Chloroflexota bacterium]
MADLLVVGSIGLDNIETPSGQVAETLGGSAIYFSLAASLFGKVNLVGVVGEDFPEKHRALLAARGVNTEGLQVRPGRTFRWAGCYDDDLNTAHTLDTQLNVFAEFHPQLPEAYRDVPFVFLANIDPELQLEVLSQVRGARLRVLDTMNFWIERKRPQLLDAMRSVDVVLMNDGEVRQLAGTYNLISAARYVLTRGPRVLVIKKGEHGAVMFSEGGYFVAPAYPLAEVRDPTGAGDTFAGGFVGYLSQADEPDEAALRQAVVHGSVVASFTCQDFGVACLATLDRATVAQRYREFSEFTSFPRD